jgi:hypothetical protein
MSSNSLARLPVRDSERYGYPKTRFTETAFLITSISNGRFRSINSKKYTNIMFVDQHRWNAVSRGALKTGHSNIWWTRSTTGCCSCISVKKRRRCPSPTTRRLTITVMSRSGGATSGAKRLCAWPPPSASPSSALVRSFAGDGSKTHGFSLPIRAAKAARWCFGDRIEWHMR